MSEVKTDKLSPRTASGTITLGTSGDTFSIPSGVTLSNSGTASGFLPSSISTSGTDFQFNSGYGSTVTAYGCRAWVNFNGSGTLAIRSSGNVSSVTDNGTGDYTVNFTNSMPDDNYSVSICCNHPSSMVSPLNTARGNLTTSAFHIYTLNASFAVNDAAYVLAQIIR